INISIFGESATSQVVFIVTAPGIARFTPMKGLPGDTVTITSIVELDSTVTVEFGNVPAQVLSVVHNVVTVVVPKGVVTAPITLNFYGLSASSTSNFIVVKPAILSFTPDKASKGRTVTITMNYLPTLGELSVKFGDQQAIVNSLVDSIIGVTVPPRAITAPITVTWNGIPAVSDSSFIVLSPYSGCVVEFGNIPAYIDQMLVWQAGRYEDTNRSADLYQWGFSFPDTPLCMDYLPNSVQWNGDTVVMKFNGHNDICTITMAIDTIQHVIRYLNAYDYFNFCYDERGDMDYTISNIPYNISPSGLIEISLTGNAIAAVNPKYSFFAWGDYNFPQNGTTRTRNLDSVLSVTDSSYIRITLSP
ncbi:MAG TPA: hypothetical protein VFJ29_05910, partial [Candidatus Kapabacteria bacterium]|nr:hypothetical protein [Candidatus Kapabacteria bacterium]